MRDSFYEWYRRININPTSDQLQNRWASLETYCKSDKVDILSLSTLFFGLPTDSDFVENFAEVFINQDATFLKSNKRELSFLAGSSLIYLLEDDKHSIQIALAINILSMLATETDLSEILSACSEKLHKITLQNREVDIKIQNIPGIGIDNLKKVMPDEDITTEGIKALISSISATSTNFTKISANQKVLANSLKMYKEDSNILSWLVGEASNDLHKPLTNRVNPKDVALILGKELADLVESTSGPYAAKDFLRKMLKLCKRENPTISLLEVVDSLSTDWKKLISNEYIEKIEANTPILLAIAKSLEVSETQVWRPIYETAIGINPELIRHDLLEWSYSMYLECLLVKTTYGED